MRKNIKEKQCLEFLQERIKKVYIRIYMAWVQFLCVIRWTKLTRRSNQLYLTTKLLITLCLRGKHHGVSAILLQ